MPTTTTRDRATPRLDDFVPVPWANYDAMRDALDDLAHLATFTTHEALTVRGGDGWWLDRARARAAAHHDTWTGMLAACQAYTEACDAQNAVGAS